MYRVEDFTQEHWYHCQENGSHNGEKRGAWQKGRGGYVREFV